MKNKDTTAAMFLKYSPRIQFPYIPPFWSIWNEDTLTIACHDDFSVWPQAWEWNLASKGTLITGVLAIYSCRYCCCSFAAREGTHLADVTGTSLLRWLLPKQLHLSSAVHTLTIGTDLISFLRCQNREQNGEKVDIAGGPKSKFRVITSTMSSWTKNDRKRHYYLFTWETFTKH